MQLRILALAAALIGAVSVPPASAQNQGKRGLKAQQKVEEEAEKRQELLEEVQPMADRFAEAMVTSQVLGLPRPGLRQLPRPEFGPAGFPSIHYILVPGRAGHLSERVRPS